MLFTELSNLQKQKL